MGLRVRGDRGVTERIGEGNIYLIPSEILVLSICGDSGKLTLGNGKQRPRARREKRGCWVGVCQTPPIPEAAVMDGQDLLVQGWGAAADWGAATCIPSLPSIRCPYAPSPGSLLYLQP